MGLFGCPGGTGGPSGCDGPNDTPPAAVPSTGEFVVSPKAGSAVHADRVTVFGYAPPGAVGVFGNAQPGVIRADGTYFVHNVPLRAGANDILVVATDAHDHAAASETVAVNADGSQEPLVLRLSTNQVQPNEPVVATITSPLTISKLSVDFDDDGAFESESSNLAAEHAYETAGDFAIRVVAETNDGLLFSVGGRDAGTAEHRVRVGAAVHGGELSIADPLAIVGQGDGTAWILAGRSLVQVDATPTVLRSIDLPPSITASALAVDSDGRFVLVETTGNRITRLLPSGEIDTSFGVAGSVSILANGGGQLAAPNDITAGENGVLFVSDAGNRRIVRLSSVGGFEKAVAVEQDLTSLDFQNGGIYAFNGTATVLVYQDFLRPEKPLALAASNLTSGSSLLGSPTWNAANQSQLFVINASDSVERRIETGLSDVFDVATVNAKSGPMALVVGHSGRVVAVPLTEESQGERPEDLWSAFLTRVAVSDVDGALQFVHPRNRERILARLNALSVEQRTSLAGSFGAVRPIEKGEVYSFYEVEVGASTARVTFIRDPATRRWFIGSF